MQHCQMSIARDRVAKKALEIIPDVPEGFLGGENLLMRGSADGVEQGGGEAPAQDVSPSDARDGDEYLVAVLVNTVGKNGRLGPARFALLQDLGNMGQGAVY